jgi:L-lactate permease
VSSAVNHCPPWRQQAIQGVVSKENSPLAKIPGVIMVCINNIVAVCSVLGIEKKEGDILKRTFLPTIVYGIIAVIAGLLL